MYRRRRKNLPPISEHTFHESTKLTFVMAEIPDDEEEAEVSQLNCQYLPSTYGVFGDGRLARGGKLPLNNRPIANSIACADVVYWISHIQKVAYTQFSAYKAGAPTKHLSNCHIKYYANPRGKLVPHVLVVLFDPRISLDDQI